MALFIPSVSSWSFLNGGGVLPSAVPLTLGAAIAIVLIIGLVRRFNGRRRAQASWPEVRDRVRPAVSFFISWDAPADPAAAEFPALRGAIDGAPVARWAAASPADDELELLELLAQEQPILDLACTALGTAVDRALAQSEASRYSLAERAYLRMATFRGAGPVGDTRDLIDRTNSRAVNERPDRYAELDVLAKSAGRTDDVMEAHAAYFASYRRFAQSFIALRELFFAARSSSTRR